MDTITSNDRFRVPTSIITRQVVGQAHRRHSRRCSHRRIRFPLPCLFQGQPRLFKRLENHRVVGRGVGPNRSGELPSRRILVLGPDRVVRERLKVPRPRRAAAVGRRRRGRRRKGSPRLIRVLSRIWVTQVRKGARALILVYPQRVAV